MARPDLWRLREVDRIEGDFEHQGLLDLADRAEALDRVVAHEPVEPFQLLVGEAEIGLADRQQLARLASSSRRCSPNNKRSACRCRAPRTSARNRRSSGSRFHLYQRPALAAGDIGAVAALQHHPLDRGVAGAGADLLERLEILRLDQRGEVEALGIEPGGEGFEPRAGARSAAARADPPRRRTRCRRAGRRRDSRRASSPRRSCGRAVAGAR